MFVTDRPVARYADPLVSWKGGPRAQAIFTRALRQGTSGCGPIGLQGFGGSYGVAVFEVPASQPEVPVRVVDETGATAGWQKPYQAQLDARGGTLPIPDDFGPAGGTDGEAVLLQRRVDGRVLYAEMFKAAKATDGAWTYRVGQVVEDMRGWDGTGVPLPSGSDWFGVNAARLALLAGLTRVSEVKAGRIPHALTFVFPKSLVANIPASSVVSGRLAATWPARYSDGSMDPGLSAAVPLGTWLRLHPGVVVDTLPLTDVVKVFARAMQDYGLVLIDSTGATGNIGIQAEASSEWQSVLGGWPTDVLRTFPWQFLQVLDSASMRERLI